MALQEFHNNKFRSYNGSKCPACNQNQFVDTKVDRKAEKKCLICDTRTSTNLWNRRSEFKSGELENVVFAVVKYGFEWDQKQVPTTAGLFYNISDAMRYRKSILREHWIQLLQDRKFDDNFSHWQPKIEAYTGAILEARPDEIVDDLIFVLDNYVFYNEFTQIYFKLKDHFDMVQIHVIEDKGGASSNSRYLIYEEHLVGLESYYNTSNKNGRPILSISQDKEIEPLVKEIELKQLKKYVLNKSVINEWAISEYLSGNRDEKWHQYETAAIKLEDKLKAQGISSANIGEQKTIEKIKELIEAETKLKFVQFCNYIEMPIV